MNPFLVKILYCLPIIVTLGNSRFLDLRMASAIRIQDSISWLIFATNGWVKISERDIMRGVILH